MNFSHHRFRPLGECAQRYLLGSSEVEWTVIYAPSLSLWGAQSLYSVSYTFQTKHWLQYIAKLMVLYHFDRGFYIKIKLIRMHVYNYTEKMIFSYAYLRINKYVKNPSLCPSVLRFVVNRFVSLACKKLLRVAGLLKEIKCGMLSGSSICPL